MKYALVKFKDSNRSLKYLVLTKDIKGYQPGHADDIPDKEYLVKWQDSFDGEEGMRHDGCYKANILLVAATIEELKLKARDLKIKLPANMPSVQSQESKPAAMSKPLRKSHRRRNEEVLERESKKKRMGLTLSILDERGTEQDKTAKESEPSRNLKALLDLDHRAKAPAQSSAKNVTKSKEYTTEKTDQDVDATEDSPEALDSEPAYEATPSKEESKQETVSNKTTRERMSRKNLKGLLDLDHSATASALSSAKKLTKSKENMTEKTDSDQDVNTIEDSPGPLDSERTHKASPSKEESKPETGINKTTRERMNRETFKGLRDLDHSASASAPSVREESKSKKSTHESKDCDQQRYIESYRKIRGSNTDKPSSQPLDSELDVKDRSKKAMEWSEDNDFTPTEDEDEDDATVLLDKLKKEHRLCDIRYANLQESNKKLKDGMKTYKIEMEKKREMIKKLSEENEILRQLNLSLQREKFQQRSQSAKPARSSTPAEPLTSELLFEESDDESTAVDSPADHQQKKAKPTPSLVKKELFKDNLKADDEGTASDCETVTKRIERDLKGVKDLEVDGDRVYVGMNMYINKNFWSKTIRLQRDDSKFLKDCAQAVWGIEALKVRNPGKQTANKKAATPVKVNLVYAMLRGKLRARGLEKSQEDFIIDTCASKWLGQKMYDCGRPPKPKKETPP